MSLFTCLLGEPALSGFRRQKLLERVQRAHEPALAVDARWVYFVQSARPLAGTDLERLQELLHGRRVDDLPANGLALVVPRLGTRSPWSSKATDIAARCGLGQVACIERGTAFWIRSAGRPSPDAEARVHACLHAA